MAELVDALDLGSSGVIHGGSSPFTRTNLFKAVSFFEIVFFNYYINIILKTSVKNKKLNKVN